MPPTRRPGQTSRREEPEALDHDTLTGTAYSAYRHALQDQHPLTHMALPEFGELDPIEQEAWGMAVRRASTLIEDSETNQTTFPAVAAAVYGELAGYTGLARAWDALTAIEQLAWQAIVRHLTNALVFDPGDHEDGELSMHEAHWGEWTRNRLAALGNPTP